MTSTARGASTSRWPIVAAGGLALLTLIVGLRFGTVLPVALSLVGITVFLIFFRRNLALALLGMGLSVVALFGPFIIGLFGQ